MSVFYQSSRSSIIPWISHFIKTNYTTKLQFRGRRIHKNFNFGALKYLHSPPTKPIRSPEHINQDKTQEPKLPTTLKNLNFESPLERTRIKK